MANPIRYSPLPITAYVRVMGKRLTGPAYSDVLVNSLAAWNLAYLSHPYECDALPSKGQFAVLVRRSLEVVMDTGEINPAAPVANRLAGLMVLPAPQAVRRIAELACLTKVPLFMSFGQAWVDRMQERSWKVQQFDTEYATTDDQMADLRCAETVIRGIFRRA